MLKSINEICKLVRNDRATIARRAEELRLIPVDGPGIGANKAKLYETHELLQLVPLPSRAAKKTEGADNLDDAKIRALNAAAQKNEIEAEKMKKNLMDVGDAMRITNALFDGLSSAVKSFDLTDNQKEDMMGQLDNAVREWTKLIGP
jgi:hypothetical protein